MQEKFLPLTAANSFDYDNPNELFTYQWNVNAPCNINTESNNNSEEIIINAPNSSDDSCDISLTLTDSQGLQSNSFSGTDIFISEIAEASTSSNTYIELYNGTPLDVDLTDYSLIIVKNGSGAEYPIDLSNQSISPGETFLVVRTAGSDVLELLDNPNYITFSNINKISGDDAIELVQGWRIN